MILTCTAYVQCIDGVHVPTAYLLLALQRSQQSSRQTTMATVSIKILFFASAREAAGGITSANVELVMWC